MPLIETKDLCFSYKKGTKFANKALNNINIKIEKGDFIGIIGHTGSGKSTLIQHLNALLKPTSGAVYFDFEVPTELEGVDTGILDPRDTYADPAEWDRKAQDLAGRFIKNFHKYTTNKHGKALVKAGPHLD